MSLAAMVLADRTERLVRFYDRWVGLITFGRDARVRNAVAAEIQAGERLLDVGCGTGSLAVAVARAGSAVLAIDRSPAMLAVARSKAASAGVTVDWREGEASAPPAEAGPFDVATATFVLGELSRDLADLAIRRLAEALRPGGRLIVADEIPPDRLVFRLLAAIPRSVLAAVSFAALPQLAPSRRHPWRELLENAGLDVESERRYGAGLEVLIGRRPAELPRQPRPITRLRDVMPAGPRRAILRAAAWLALPIAVPPGVYRLGQPGSGAPVLLTGNFLASVEAVETAMTGRDAYVVVEDCAGWNVWCASDAGLFNGAKAAALLDLYDLAGVVDERRVVVPRLAGRVRAELAAASGWDVTVGPIEARDLPTFLASGLRPEMRSLARLYGLPERLRVGVLTLLQLALFLLPLRRAPRDVRRPALRFAAAASCLLPLAHDRLPGRTGVAKATYLGLATVAVGTAGRRLRPVAAGVLLASAPLVGWVYQSTSPVVFWKRLWH